MSHQKTSERPRILILDDEPMVGELLHDMLGLFGYSASSCTSPARALELLEHEKFDLILSDYQMPQMSGQEFYDRALELDPALGNRIVFITGDAANEDTNFFLKSTGTAHLAKPFQLATMKTVIEDTLEKNRSLAA